MKGMAIKILRAATTYFAFVFAAGFVLGPIRVLLIVPRVGERVAELMEFPLMLVVIVFAAKWVVRRFRLATNRLAVGLLALALMIVFEFTLVLWLRGLTLPEYFHQRDPVASSIYYLMLLVFALMPSFVAHRTNHDSVHS